MTEPIRRAAATDLAARRKDGGLGGRNSKGDMAGFSFVVVFDFSIAMTLGIRFGIIEPVDAHTDLSELR
jgi:hypothetical protein